MKEAILLSIILILAFIVRLYHLTSPLADWHSWRQADTASVTREYVKHGIDLVHPKYQDLSSIPNGKPNPNGYRMVEFPFVNALTAAVYNVVSPHVTLEIHVVARLVSIFFSLGSTMLLYLIIIRFYDVFPAKTPPHTVALLSALMFALLPYNIFYSRSILPEVPLVFFCLLTLWLSLCYLKSNKLIHLSLTIASASLALLLKPTAGFYFIPILALFFKAKGWRFLFSSKHLVSLVLVLLPLIWWRLWIQQFPTGIPANRWLLNGTGIRFRPAWFRWLFADRLGRLILGYWGLPLFVYGINSLQTKSFESKQSNRLIDQLSMVKNYINSWSAEAIFLNSWLISLFAYLAIFATGNVQHDYYQIILIPLVCIFLAKGISNLVFMGKLSSLLLATWCFGLMLSMGWYEVRGYFNINNPAIVAAGKAVDAKTPKDALVIAPYMGDTAFLYQTNRRGWPIGGDIDEKITAGAQYYITTSNDDEAKQLLSRYRLIDQTNDYLLIKLD